MKNDLYTKTVLTVIAGCLLVLCASSLLKPRGVQAQAIPPVQRVVIVGIDTGQQQLKFGLPVDLAFLGPTGQLQSLPVTIIGANSNIPVNVNQVAGQNVGKEGILTTTSK